jgi:hypothetical protein
LHKQYYIEKEKVDRLVARKNQKTPENTRKHSGTTESMTATNIRYLPESLHRYTGDTIWMKKQIRISRNVSASTQ